MNFDLCKMADAGEGTRSGLSEEAESLSTASLWKGENDSDSEQMEAYDTNPLASVRHTCLVSLPFLARAGTRMHGRRGRPTPYTARSW